MTKNAVSTEKKVLVEQERGVSQVSRRKFLNYAGATSGLVVLAAGCKKDNSSTPANGGVDLGSGDTGILNYAYALD